MAPVLFILFIVVPVIEIALFIQVGGWLGVWPTVGLVLLTAVVGTSLLRAQGVQTLRRAQAQLDQGQLPVREVFDGACLLVAGVLLLTPGFMTDAFGLALFLPVVRSALLALLAKGVQSGKIHMRTTTMGHGPFTGPTGGGGGFPPGSRGPADLEGDYRDITPEDEPSSSGSPSPDSTPSEDTPRRLPNGED